MIRNQVHFIFQSKDFSGIVAGGALWDAILLGFFLKNSVKWIYYEFNLKFSVSVIFYQVFIYVCPCIKVWSHFIVAGRAPPADLAFISTIITSPLTSLQFRPLLRSQGTEGNFQNESGKKANSVRLCSEQSQGRCQLSGDRSLERWW